MGKTREKTEEKLLEIGDEVYLDVDIHLKTQQLSFKPWFVDDDEMVVDDDYGLSCNTIRIFNHINNGFILENEELWLAKVVGIKIAPSEMITKDRRRYVFVNVEVVKRVEDEISYVDHNTKQYITEIVSGQRLIRTTQTSISEKKTEYRCDNFVFIFAEYLLDKKVIKRTLLNTIKREVYIDQVRKLLGRTAPSDLQPLFTGLPVVTRGQLEKLLSCV